jgi:hypothetical protein
MNFQSLIIVGMCSIRFYCPPFINESRHLNIIRKEKCDTVIKDIPVDSNGQPKMFFLLKRIIERKIDLPTLENGFDSLQIRIWYGQAFSDSLQLIVFKHSKARWSAQLYNMFYHYDKTRDSIVSIDKNVKAIIPQRAWKYFMMRINRLKITSLPDASQIPDYGECQDGYGVTIEVASVSKYKIYNYSCFREYYTIWQANKIEQLMELLEKQFRFKRLAIPSVNQRR